MCSADFTDDPVSVRELLLTFGFSNKNFQETICLFIVFCVFIHNIRWKYDRRV